MPPSFLPPRLDFDNYRAVLNSSVPFLQIYANSVEVAVLVTVGQLVTCTLAAFAFARLNFPGRDSLFFIMLAGLLFPAQVTIIPIYLGFARSRPAEPADRARAHVSDLELRRLSGPPVHALAAEGARRGGADGRRRLSQDLLPHLAAAAAAGARLARHHHLHPDLELLFPGARAARAAGRDDAADRDGRAARLSRLGQPRARHGGDEHVGAARHPAFPARAEDGDRRHRA